MTKKNFTTALSVFLLLILVNLTLVGFCFADRPSFSDYFDNLDRFSVEAGYEPSSGISSLMLPEIIMGNFIVIILSIVGVFYLGLVVYGGYIWFTARGNKEQVGQAVDILRDSTIGLAIVVGAYAISYFVVYYFVRATQLGGPMP